MPDPSDESLPSQKRLDPSRPTTPTGTGAHLTPAPRVIPAHVHHLKESQKPAATAPLPPGFGEALEWLRRHAHTDALAAAPPAGKRSSRALLPKEQRKFHKFDPEHLTPELTGSGGAEPSPQEVTAPWDVSDGEPLPVGDHPRMITSEQLAFIRRLRQEAPDRSPWLAVGIAVVVFLLVAGAFLAGHFSLPKTVVPDSSPAIAPTKSALAAVAPEEMAASAFELIDQAMAAETAKNYPKAIELLEQAQRDAGHIYGLNYRLASLCYQANDMTRVLPLLNLSITQGEEVAACYSLRGTLSNQYGRTSRGPGDLERATQLDPFDARYFFVWGEALRRAGDPQMALPQLKRAVNRLQEPVLLGIYSLKLRLTELELGREDLFAAELASALKSDPPPVDWLLTAAALEMHRRDFPVAAGHLLKVRQLIGARETALQLRDVYFAKYAQEKELSNFYDVPDASSSSAVATP